MAGFVACDHAFLFSLVNLRGLSRSKMSLITGRKQCGIYCRSDCGPVFGGGHDLYISNNANTNMTSRSRLGSTYQYPPELHGTFLTGDEYFIVTDYEIFLAVMTNQQKRSAYNSKDAVIDRMANSESNKMMQNFFVLYPGMNVLAVIRRIMIFLLTQIIIHFNFDNTT